METTGQFSSLLVTVDSQDATGFQIYYSPIMKKVKGTQTWGEMFIG